MDFCLKASREFLHSPRSSGQKWETGSFQKQDFASKSVVVNMLVHKGFHTCFLLCLVNWLEECKLLEDRNGIVLFHFNSATNNTNTNIIIIIKMSGTAISALLTHEVLTTTYVGGTIITFMFR